VNIIPIELMLQGAFKRGEAPLSISSPSSKKILNPNIEILNGRELRCLVFRISCLVLSSGEGDTGGEVDKERDCFASLAMTRGEGDKRGMG